MYKEKIVALMMLALIGSTSIAYAENNSKPATSQYIDDAATTAKVKSVIFNDSELKGLDINIETYKGTVLLSGFVDNQAAVDQAEKDASKVPDVQKVNNALLVKDLADTQGKYLDDTLITTKVKKELINNPDLSGLDIHVKTHHGVVQLSGFVESAEKSNLAVEDARAIEGVKKVVNSLVIK